MLILRCYVAVRHRRVPTTLSSPSPTPCYPAYSLARNSPALQTTSVAFPRERRGRQDSLARSWDEEEKPFRCSTGRRTMHLRPHYLSRQSSPPPELSLLHSVSRRVALLTHFSRIDDKHCNCDKLDFVYLKMRDDTVYDALSLSQINRGIIFACLCQ